MSESWAGDERASRSTKGSDGDTPGTWVSFLGLLAVIAALLSFAAGGIFVWIAPSKPDLDAVRCGDDVMRSGDTCLVFGGDTDDEGFDEGGDLAEMRANQQEQARSHDTNHRRAGTAFRVGGGLLAAGLALVVVGLVITSLVQRRRTRAGAPTSTG